MEYENLLESEIRQLPLYIFPFLKAFAKRALVCLTYSTYIMVRCRDNNTNAIGKLACYLQLQKGN